MGTEPVDFCREVEAYLCRKNDGHLIRITGPSFELVSYWAEQGIPLKVAFGGIDRYFERYYAKGPRRRPVRIDFCEPDVLDLFDEWRRATGITAQARSSDGDSVAAVAAVVNVAPEAESRTGEGRRGASLPAHMERALRRLTSARAGGTLDERFDELLDRVAQEFDRAKGIRGEKRDALLERLSALDRELLAAARATLEDAALAAMTHEADAELAPFRGSMTSDAFARAREAAIDRLVRERMGLPTLAFF